MYRHMLSFVAMFTLASLLSSIYISTAPVQAVKRSGIEKSSVSVSARTFNSAKLSWTKSSTATRYKLYRSTGTSKNFKHIKTTKYFSYTDKKLKTGTRYYYKVVPYRDKVKGPASKTLSVKLSLSSPKLYGSNRAAGSSKLSWSKVSGASGYKIYRLSGTTYKHIATTKKMTYTDKKVNDEKIYNYKVRGYRLVSNKVVHGPPSKTVKVTTLPGIYRYGLVTGGTTLALGGETGMRGASVDLKFLPERKVNSLQFSNSRHTGYVLGELKQGGVSIRESSLAGTGSGTQRSIVIEQTDSNSSGHAVVYVRVDYALPPLPLTISWSPYPEYATEETGYERVENGTFVTHLFHFRIHPNSRFEQLKPNLAFTIGKAHWSDTTTEKCLPEQSTTSIISTYDGNRDFTLSCVIPVINATDCSGACPLQSTRTIYVDTDAESTSLPHIYRSGVMRDGALSPNDPNIYPRLRYVVPEFESYRYHLFSL